MREYTLLSEEQCGFRDNRVTLLALMEFVEKSFTAVKKKEYALDWV